MKTWIVRKLETPALAVVALALAGLSICGAAAGGNAHLPTVALHFEPNLGQTDERVRFLGRGAGYTLFFTPQEVVLALREERAGETSVPGVSLPATEPVAQRGHVLRMKARGASATARLEPHRELEGTSSYLRLDGSPSTAAVPHFAEVRYTGLYPGIDQVFYGNGGVLEYDFVIAPGADPSAIELAVQGAESMAVDASGNLVLATSVGDVVQPPPVIYQEIGGERRAVAGGYRLTAEAGVAFTVAGYDRSRELVIDPQILFRACTGGSSADGARAIAVTPNGQAYIAGETTSTDFPTHAGAVQRYDLDGTSTDGFVAKLNLAGTAFIHATYIGGAGYQQVTAIGLDASHSVYAGGITTQGNSYDAFLLKLDSTLGTLLWSKTFGGGNVDDVLDLAVNGAGDAFVSGVTYSPEFCGAGIVHACGIDSQFAGSAEAFVLKFNRHGALRYATYLGGTDDEFGQAIAIDGADRAYVAVFRFGGNPYVTRIDAAGTRLEYTRVLPGAGIPNDIAVDGLDQAHVTGLTEDRNFYTTLGAYQRSLLGPFDGFVTALRADGTCCVYSTFLGNASAESMEGIAVDFRRQPHVVGTRWPYADVGDYRTTDVVVARLNASGTQLISQQVLGGSASESGEAIALDYNPATFVAGVTSSANFAPGAPGCNANDTGNEQAFVVKLAM